MPLTATQLVRALIARPPNHLSELEDVVGPVHVNFADSSDNMGHFRREEGVHPAIASMWVGYRWDIYHEDRTRPRDLWLEDLEVTLREDRSTIEALLAESFGPPRAITHTIDIRGTPHRSDYAAYPPFFVRTRELDQLPMLSWYRELPEFAMYKPTAENRRAWLVQLRQCCDAAVSIDEIAALCNAAPSDAGITIRGTMNSGLNRYAAFTFPTDDSRDYNVSFTPPVNALLLADAFGIESPIGATHDVHHSSWQIEPRNAENAPLTGAHQHWQIEARFKWSPSGQRIVSRPGHTAMKEIGADDEILYFSIRPRFR